MWPVPCLYCRALSYETIVRESFLIYVFVTCQHICQSNIFKVNIRKRSQREEMNHGDYERIKLVTWKFFGTNWIFLKKGAGGGGGGIEEHKNFLLVLQILCYIMHNLPKCQSIQIFSFVLFLFTNSVHSSLQSHTKVGNFRIMWKNLAWKKLNVLKWRAGKTN